MDLGRLLCGVVLIVGLYFIGKNFWTGVQESTPPPTLYILTHDTRVNAAGNGLVVTNKDHFPWPKPIFTINGAYQYFYPGNLAPGETRDLPYSKFKDDQELAFPPTFEFHNFDIRTATMAMRKR